MRTLEDRLYSNIQQAGDCWIWQGAKNNRGYGQITVHNQRKLAHRVSFELHVGPIPDGHFCCHKCDRPACVNPDHLFLGTNADNMRDCAIKGRCNVQRPEMIRTGEQHPMARLTAAKVASMRTLYQTGAFDQATLARRFGISTSQAHNILTWKQWRHAA